MQNSVTILLATFNGEKYLDEQLASYLAQTHQNWFLYVSDDGSTDRTIEILTAFQQKIGTDRMQIIAGAKTGYANNFLNMIYHCSFETDFYCFSDQDDIWLPHKISSFVTEFNLQADVQKPAIYYARTILMDEKGQAITASQRYLGYPSFYNALVQNVMSGNTQAFNRAFQQSISQKPVQNVVSHDWWLYIFSTGIAAQIIFDDQPVLLYRQHDNNLIGSNNSFRSKLHRLYGMVTRRYWAWTEGNLNACQVVQDIFTQHHKTVLHHFKESRQGLFFKRLYYLHKSGVRRRSFLQNSALAVDTFLHKNTLPYADTV